MQHLINQINHAVYHNTTSAQPVSVCSDKSAKTAERKLYGCDRFGKIINNTQHRLYCLLLPQRDHELRQRVRNFQLSTRSSSLLDSNSYVDAV